MLMYCRSSWESHILIVCASVAPWKGVDKKTNRNALCTLIMQIKEERIIEIEVCSFQSKSKFKVHP